MKNRVVEFARLLYFSSQGKEKGSQVRAKLPGKCISPRGFGHINMERGTVGLCPTPHPLDHRGQDQSLRRRVVGFWLARANFSVGVSRSRPFRMMGSAAVTYYTAEGAGSKVWEPMPPGMRPWRSMNGPPTFVTRLVRGATVVSTFGRRS